MKKSFVIVCAVAVFCLEFTVHVSATTSAQSCTLERYPPMDSPACTSTYVCLRVCAAVAVPERSQHVPAGLQEVAVLCLLARRRHRLLPGKALTPLVRWRYCAFRRFHSFCCVLHTAAVI